MTIKQKFSSIDQSKLTADQKAFLTKIKTVTKNFTDAEMNKKVEAPLNGFIEKAKEKMPEAIKSAPVKRTSKAKPSQTRKPKRTAMSLAKEIRKQGESWNDARARASKMMKEDSKDLSKTVETELDKLSKLVRSTKNRAKLSGLSGTNIKRDAVRRAKPKGRRISKEGNVYYENRDNRTDRLAPNYPKNAPLLAEGGYLTDPNFGNFQNDVMFSRGGATTNERKHVNHDEDYEVRYSKPRPARKGYKGVRNFAVGGTVVTDLAGHTGGGDAGLNAGMPLSGVSGTNYTGLVGETGAMSSGELFARGGAVGDNVLGLKKGDIYKIVDTFHTASYDTTMSVFTFIDYEDKYNEIVLKSIPFPPDPKKKNDFVYVSQVSSDGVKVLNDTEIGEVISRKYKNFVKNNYELGGGLPSGAEQSYMITEALGNPAQHYAKGGGVRQVGNREYSYGRNWTNDHRHINKGENHEVKYNRKGKFLGVFNNGGYLTDPNFGNFQNDVMFSKGGATTNERKHVNHDEDYEVRYSKPRPSRKGYKGARKFMAGGMNGETPRIYVADLEAYNNGKLNGEWLDLTDYNDADELMNAIQNLLDGWGVEEYAIHDVEYVPSSLYSEYMGQRDFEQLYEIMELANDNDLPLVVVEDVVSQFGASAVEEFQGKYDSAVDFAEQLVDEMGIQSFNDFEYYLEISDTDRRLLSQEMADSYTDDIKGEDGGNRIIEEAGLNLDEYEDASEQAREEMVDLATSMVNDEYYDNFYEGLSDPYYFLVEEQGLYDAESFANANFVRVDYDKLAEALEQDYTMIEYDGDVYVFNIR